MHAIETLDVSLPRPSTRAEKAAAAARDVLLALLIVFALPLGLIVVFSPVVVLVRFALGLAGLL